MGNERYSNLYTSIRTQYGGICEAVIGLEKEATQEELNELKVQMKYKILEYLSDRKDEYLRNYNNKVECLNEIKD